MLKELSSGQCSCTSWFYLCWFIIWIKVKMQLQHEFKRSDFPHVICNQPPKTAHKVSIIFLNKMWSITANGTYYPHYMLLVWHDIPFRHSSSSQGVMECFHIVEWDIPCCLLTMVQHLSPTLIQAPMHKSALNPLLL